MRPFKRKLLSMLLCGAFLCSLCTRTAFAEAGETSGASTDGLCEHHTEHDDDCGYTEGTPETPCGHECSEESGCITETLNCTHEHDEACGYQPAVEGTPCGYVCALCGADEDSTEPANEKETSLPADDLPDEPEQEDGQKTFTVAQMEAMIFPMWRR